MLDRAAHPVLTCAQALDFEKAFFAGDEEREWAAMQRAGAAVASAALGACEEMAGLPTDGRILVLVGKGHNGGDALLAAKDILLKYPAAVAEIVLPYGVRALRPLALRAYQALTHLVPNRITSPREIRGAYALSLDGVFGFRFRPPLDATATKLLARANESDVRLRAAVDLPSGLGDSASFRADFTYATGSVKAPVLDQGHHAQVGRLRYLDLGFFPEGRVQISTLDSVLTPKVLKPLCGLRPAKSDKRTFGHVFILGGSRHMPGALMMSARAALRSGAGLVTVFAPESAAPSFAARLPEAMWVSWPETPSGGLALEGIHLLRERIKRSDTLIIGPGAGRDPETEALFKDILKEIQLPAVLDA